MVVGFGISNNPRTTLQPLEDRVTNLSNRIGQFETTQTGLAGRLDAAETTISKNTAAVNSIFAETRKIEKVLAVQSEITIPSPEERAAEISLLRQLESRVAQLESKVGLPATAAERVPDTAKAGDDSEKSFPPFDPVNFNPELIWLAISFGVLYLLMAKIALPRVQSILGARADKISSDIADANGLRAKAEEASAAHDKVIADAKSDALALARQTHARLLAETEAKRSTLESELNARLAASEQQIAETKARAMSNVQAIAKEAAAAIVQRITGKPADAAAIANAAAALKS
ncbi:MAG: hypothetical protein J2P49_09640 [Methylocapsa sp.]|nr:hypothetical protein [Methylocapsa sp.]